MSAEPIYRVAAFFTWLLITPLLVAIHLAQWAWETMRGIRHDGDEGD